MLRRMLAARRGRPEEVLGLFADSQVIPLEAGWYSGAGVTRGWVQAGNARPTIDDVLTAVASVRLSHIVFSSNGKASLYTTGSTGSPVDMSAAFEQYGSLTVEAGNVSLTVRMAGRDLSSQYDWFPSNSSEIAAFYNALSSVNDSTAGTLTLRDYELPFEQVIDLPASAWNVDGSDRGWVWDTGRPEIADGLKVSSVSRFLRSIRRGLSQFSMDIEETAIGPVSGGHHLSPAFGNFGAALIEVGSLSVTVRTAGIDPFEPYQFSSINNQEFLDFIADVDALPANQRAGKLTLRNWEPRVEQVVTLDASTYTEAVNTAAWTLSDPNRVAIVDGLKGTTADRLFAQFYVTTLGVAVLSLARTQSESAANAGGDLSPAFEHFGSVTIDAAGQSLTLNVGTSGDLVEPYGWPAGTTGVADFATAVRAASGNQAAKLTLRNYRV